jgi:ABC-2 type transport system permease protein
VAATSAIARRTFADARKRTFAFLYFFAAVAAINVIGYRKSYPDVADRIRFARGFGDNKAVRLFYGVPHDLMSTGGYAAWRVGGLMSIFAAMYGLLAAVRALRAEEDSGRQELVLAGPVSRGAALRGALAGVFAGIVLLWLATWLGFVITKLAVGPSAFLALATVVPAAVFAGAGVLASQVAGSRRVALELGSALLAGALLLRVVADTTGGAGWLRWISPLGWSEEMRAFAGPRPAVLLLPLAATVLLLAAAVPIALRRDVGSGLLPVRDSAAPDHRLLGSPTRLALRLERGSLLGWLIGVGLFAFVIGIVSDSIRSVGLSENLQKQLEKLGAEQVTTPSGYIAFSFLFFILAVALFCCSQMAAAHREEAEQRLETLFALPVSRRSWLGGRLLLAVAGAAVVALCAGVLAWAGAKTQGVHVSFTDLLGAGANTLPASLLFLGIAALAFALVPRASAGIAYGLTTVAFVWELFGALLGAPKWTLALSPFHHVGLVPAQSFETGAALAMLAIAAATSVAAVLIFQRRDLTGP